MTENLHRGTLPNPTNPFKIWNWWCTGAFHFWLVRLQKQKVQIYWSLEVFQEKNFKTQMRKKSHKPSQLMCLASWRNGSASDFSSEGCVFNSCRGQNECLQLKLGSLSWRFCSINTHFYMLIFLFKNNFIYFQNSLNFFWQPTGPCDKIVWSVFSSGSMNFGVVCLGNMLDRAMEPPPLTSTFCWGTLRCSHTSWEA